jgi:hypothetical protein
MKKRERERERESEGGIKNKLVVLMVNAAKVVKFFNFLSRLFLGLTRSTKGPFK